MRGKHEERLESFPFLFPIHPKNMCHPPSSACNKTLCCDRNHCVSFLVHQADSVGKGRIWHTPKGSRRASNSDLNKSNVGLPCRHLTRARHAIAHAKTEGCTHFASCAVSRRTAAPNHQITKEGFLFGPTGGLLVWPIKGSKSLILGTFSGQSFKFKEFIKAYGTGCPCSLGSLGVR